MLEVWLLALALSIDGFALSTGWAISHARSPKIWLLPIAFTIVQPVIVALGWIGGGELGHWLGHEFRYAAGGLLTLIGLKMGWEGCCAREDHAKEQAATEPDGIATTLMTLLLLVIASNVDAALAGVSTAHLLPLIWQGIAVMAGVALGLTLIGTVLGQRIGEVLGKRAGALGGLVLIGLGIKTLIGA